MIGKNGMQIFCWRIAQQKNDQEENTKKSSYVNITVQPVQLMILQM